MVEMQGNGTTSLQVGFYLLAFSSELPYPLTAPCCPVWIFECISGVVWGFIVSFLQTLSEAYLW